MEHGGARPLVMGVLNVTPDSFSDGGRYMELEKAVAHGLAMARQGADVIDVGGESSRPRAEPVPVEEELRRVVPVVRELAPHVRVSVDTVKPAVAEAALAAGATLVNDVSGALWATAAAGSAGWVAMHMRGTPADMQDRPRYHDVVAEVHGSVLDRASRALEVGVAEVWVDPGIGFGKTSRHNLALLAHVDDLVRRAGDLGCGVRVGTSRKSFLGHLAGPAGTAGPPLPVHDRLEASLATATWAMARGVGMVRVHDVAATVQAATLVGRSAREAA